MDLRSIKLQYLLVLLAIALICVVLLVPLDLLYILSIEVVGEPPINGLTWWQGVDALGGPLSMRILASLGLLIIFVLLPLILKWEKKPMTNRSTKDTEIIFFFIIAIAFFVINFLIGYEWWDPNHILGMGPLFLPSILSLVVLAIMPEVARKIFKFQRNAFAESTANIKKISLAMVIIAFGYGLISLIWHCCSFYEPKMFFFFFVIKLIQLFAVCSFFFRWGLPLFLNRTNKWISYLSISVLFGFCYPWHTVGFAITFIIFGILLCYLTEKTNSYLTGLILLYYAYIFHAGLAWNGALITFAVIYPLSLTLLVTVLLVRGKLFLIKNTAKK